MTTTCSACGWPLHELPATSTHHTSQGLLHYRRCVCGTWQVLLDDHPLAAPTPATPPSPAP
ncbi:hypothetical protein [Kibdelosporangium phytohabitans]|uniref:Zinc finger Ogr/Delta-type domain-containing protein n=1 Tax=Kibdelosporangium phytohabitans TaxID=860235 RepID=A0A0N9I2U3_9PSEU|nr:hypothetical protein [Kibdelosporangium phytohabitans]ALG10174.1 hypothetical protein AOZ06_27690 [Kibdelosporangium phytohabitans]MBE1461181.1 hypothetical protein [Kibdelosporangium phytohabitans]